MSSALALSLLASCGGGSSPGASPPPTANQAPKFTSASNVSVAENTAGIFYQAAATDADGDPLTYSISGGADSSRFSITSSGQLAFTAAPNFDLPADANGDNIYEVQVSVSDGKVAATQALVISVTNSKEGIAVHRIANGFTDPVAISPVSDTAMLVAEKSGAVYLVNPKTGAKSLLVQIDRVGGSGVTAIAAAPSFSSDGTFFAMYTTTYGALLVNRYLRNPAGPTVPDNFGPVFGVTAPDYAGGGWLGYDASGALLAATGDAGGAGDPTGSAQDAGSRLGKVLRITPNPDPYSGAAASFFIISTIAKGLHQPNGGGRIAGGVLIADRGQDVAEEINFLPSGSGLLNYGWATKEGTHTVRGTPPADAVDPVLEYPRGAGSRSGQAIIGGAPGPSAIASLANQYVFADRSGAIFAVNSALVRQGVTLGPAMMERRDADFAPDQGAIDHPVAVTAGPDGSLYIVDADGEIFRVDGG